MTNRKFIEALTAIPNFKGDKERQVEHAYNDMLKDAFPGISISNPFKCRELFEMEKPEYQCGKVFDAGWYQVRAILKQYMPDELKQFGELYKKLSEKLLPQVYNLGFLRK